MTRWKKDETEFPVSVIVDSHRIKCTIPRPVYEKLGEPEMIKYVIKGDKVMVIPELE